MVIDKKKNHHRRWGYARDLGNGVKAKTTNTSTAAAGIKRYSTYVIWVLKEYHHHHRWDQTLRTVILVFQNKTTATAAGIERYVQ